ncbi:DNA mismatch repair protein MutS [Porphyrobacter sp. TH134]|uniref:Smr/MutS family protein n=1 Tax=Porphyrobacter sp. TH134 TaxID=2067450 RepID=UPI000C7D603A|nr:Smr/MutS family protein [Porphyrobacter sp. TH134]PLK23806.1 DNA mismatch repair protein MutS [Porphyrobacter sp. TH134]
MRAPRGLSTGEQAAWAHLAASVKPLPGKRRPEAPAAPKTPAPAPPKPAPPAKLPKPMAKPRPPAIRTPPPLPAPPVAPGLDSHWDRRMKAGRLEPDLTLDLHGHTLDTAYDRVMTALDQARAMQARVVLVVAGRERPVDPADRMAKRGAIRAKLLDWLAASRHADAITAVRRAHIRHGGEGALYLILKRRN